MAIYIFDFFVVIFGLLALMYGWHVATADPEKTLQEAQELFLDEYGYLWYPGGIVFVRIYPASQGNPACLSVGIADSEEVWHQVPEHFAGYPVCKEWVEPTKFLSQGV